MGAELSPETRLTELRASAHVLGVARVAHLGYADSGHGPVLYPEPPGQVRFVCANLDQAASALADLIRDEHADVLLSYDPQGGNGHRDHVKVHQVGARAARMTGTRVLEATVPRALAARLYTPARLLGFVKRVDVPDPRNLGSPRSSAITHRIDVRRFAARKQATLAADRSQVSRRLRFRLLVALPLPATGSSRAVSGSPSPAPRPSSPARRAATSWSPPDRPDGPGAEFLPGLGARRAISSRPRPWATASAATVQNAGIPMRPVSNLRRVCAGTPEAAEISAMLACRAPRRSSDPSRSPRSCS
jgi:LmbE family N-acetylglucosaminyl deacetylase